MKNWYEQLKWTIEMKNRPRNPRPPYLNIIKRELYYVYCIMYYTTEPIKQNNIYKLRHQIFAHS